jgi:hypothetical protein
MVTTATTGLPFLMTQKEIEHLIRGETWDGLRLD